MIYLCTYLAIGLIYAVATDSFTQELYPVKKDKNIIRILSTLFWPVEIITVIILLIYTYFESD